MKLSALLIIGFLTISQGALAQFKTIIKNAKQGVSYNGEFILKPKFDQVLVDDDSIVTAYKKDKIYYYNLNKKLIYKGLQLNSEPFQHGTGIVYHQKKGYYLLDKSGVNLLEGQLVKIQPKRFESLVFVESKKGSLFCNSQVIETEVDSVKSFGELVQVYKATVSYVTRKVWKRLKRITVTDSVSSPYFQLYNASSCEKTLDKCNWINTYAKYHLVKTNNGLQVLNPSGKLIFNDLQKVDTLGANHLVLQKETNTSLANLNTWQVEIVGQYSSFEFTDSSVFAFQENTGLVDIYVNNSKVLSELTLIDRWTSDNNILVFKDKEGVFFASTSGRRLTPSFEYINLKDKEFLRAGDSTCFTWINVKTLQQLPFYFPVIQGDESRGGGGSRLTRFLNALFGNPNSGGSGYIETFNLDEGHPFYEGLAICATNKSKSPDPFVKAYHIGAASNIRYNYINHQGEFLNSKKYVDCFPFVNGKAWVQEGSYYHLIDTNGVRFGKLRFEKVSIDKNGCFIVTSNFNEGIVDANYNLVVKCKYFHIYNEGKLYYDQYGPDKKLIYEAP